MGADMAQNTDVFIPIGVWTQLTDADVTSITFQNKLGNYIFVKGTVGAVAPTDENGAIRYNPGQGERNVSLSDLFPGVAATRVYAYSPSGSQVFVSHA